MQVPLLDLRLQYAGVRDEILAAIVPILDQQQLILGPAVEQFEKDLAAFCGTKFALGVSSGTDALLAAMMAMNIGPGDEVICPGFTFFATAGSIARTGATPVFADILPDSFNIDPKDVERKLTGKTRAIVPVHLFGQLAEIETIHAIARANNLLIIEDAAQCIGATRHGKQAGHFGDVAALSFYPTKNLGALGDAGAILTNDADLYDRCRKIRVHGSGHTYFHEMIGGMFRMAAIQAAGLGVKLKRVCKWNELRNRNAARYFERLQGTNVILPPTTPGNYHVYHQFVVRVRDRERVKQTLADKGVGSGVFYPLGLHLQQCFAHLGGKPGDLPETERATAEVLALPIYPELKRDQIDYVCDALVAATR